ncbi:hypothetical protein ACFWBF_11960 [Streptomyces sp. NPDC060028]|uniref:hypothetical protein n=1 Tax=Streptomyces sp. NPDC060028 TaxID=3347041 RepID=UPI0036C6BBE9
MAWYQGPCRITVIGVDADWPQRAVVTVHGSRARLVVPGTAGGTQLVDAQSWDLALEHRYDNEWRPNIRAVTSRWETVGGVESQVVRSKDHDWPGRTQERNLVLRIDRVGAGAGAGQELHHTLVDAALKGTARLVPGVTVGGALAPQRASAARPASSSDGIPASGATPARPATTGGTAAPHGRGYPTTSSG